jgi:hypothetical protein
MRDRTTLTTQIIQEGTLLFCTSRPSYQQQWRYELQLLRSSRVANQQKRRKVGRPKLPKGEAKGKIVPVRFTAGGIKAVEAAAKANDQTVSQWVRSTIDAALGSLKWAN